MNKKAIATFEKNEGLHYTTDHTGKMAGMISLSTCCKCNKYCMQRAKNPNLICSKCYADTMIASYKGLAAATEKNTGILTGRIIPVENWPALEIDIARIEAFGDLNNVIQQINYFNQCLKNPETIFAQWTKNPWIIAETIAAGHSKPANLIIIYSDPYIDNPADLEWIFEKYPFIDRIFRVVTKTFAAAHNIRINCGARSCITCRSCYREEGPRVIYELLKTGGQSKDEFIEKILYAGGRVTSKYVYRVIKSELHTVIARIPKKSAGISDADAIINYRWHTL